ncbi:hypothetical protein BROC_01319 [Candidatus Brocadiaceae bacterium]|nr:hypothetical protein BROC_01319 [Candidatus Brocadiaceae bacterium]
MSICTIQPQEETGTYMFTGRLYATAAIAETLSPAEISQILSAVRKRVAEHNGADYLFVFTNDEEERIFAIDQLNREMKAAASPVWVAKNDIVTVLFANEY